MFWLFKKLFFLLVLLVLLGMTPPRAGADLMMLEARSIYAFCGGGDRAMDAINSAAGLAVRPSTAKDLFESLGLRRIWHLAVLRIGSAFYAYFWALPLLAAASWLGFRQLALSRIRAMSGTSDMVFLLRKGRSLCLFALCFLVLQNSFAAFQAIAPLLLALTVLASGAASAAFASSRP
jgi:hypothetical protein